jgi:hypothetical protein
VARYFRELISSAIDVFPRLTFSPWDRQITVAGGNNVQERNTPRRRGELGHADGYKASAIVKTLLADAKAEGTLTWYSAQVDAQTSETLGRTFIKRYPGVDVAVIRTTVRSPISDS